MAYVLNGVYCTVLYCTVLYCIVLYCTVLYCTVLHCTVLYCTVLYCTVLYLTVLHCTVLYCTVLYCTALYLLYRSVRYLQVNFVTAISEFHFNAKFLTPKITFCALHDLLPDVLLRLSASGLVSVAIRMDTIQSFHIRPNIFFAPSQRTLTE